MLGTNRSWKSAPRAASWWAVCLALSGTALAGCAADPPPSDRETGGATMAGTGGPAGAGTGATPAPGASGTGGGAGMNEGAATAGMGGSAQAGTMAAAGNSGGAGSGAEVDCSALPLPSEADDVVSTFEDGTGNVNQVAGRGGGFYMFNDGTGEQTPPPGMLPNATMMSRCGGMYALCMSGSGFTTWGAGMGTDLGPSTTSDGGMMTKSPWDASAYRGISFWAKANPDSALALRVSLKDANTAPEGGNCDATMTSGAEACNDDWGKAINLTTEWAPYTILYSELTQSNWGKQFPAFDSANVYSIQFQVAQNLAFDLCIDDLAFVR